MSSQDRAACAGLSARASGRDGLFARGALALALAVIGAGGLGASACRADDLEDSVPLQHALQASRDVLLLVPQAVRQDCVDALHELSSTRESVEFNTRIRGAHNLGVARDVLAADYDTAARSCGEDAARACAAAGTPAAGAPAAGSSAASAPAAGSSAAGTPGARAGKAAGLAGACARMLPLPPP